MFMAEIIKRKGKEIPISEEAFVLYEILREILEELKRR